MAPRKYREVWDKWKGTVVSSSSLGEALHSLYTSGYLFPIRPFKGIYYVKRSHDDYPDPYSVLSSALSIKLGKNWHFTGLSASFLKGETHQPPAFVEVANTSLSGERKGILRLRFYRFSHLSPECGIIEMPSPTGGSIRVASRERVNADLLYLYLKKAIPFSRISGFALPRCSPLISPSLEKVASIFTPPPLPYSKLWKEANKHEDPQSLYIDAILSLSVPVFQSIPGLTLPLKGGTAIVKAYLGHYRYSYDMDFSLMGHVGRDCRKKWKDEAIFLAHKLGFEVRGETHTWGGRITTLLLKPPYVEKAIKLTVSCVDGKPCFRLRKRTLNSPLIKGVRAQVFSLEELLAEKLRALATRASLKEGRVLYRDLVDVYMLRNRTSLSTSCLSKKLKAVIGRETYKNALKRFLKTTSYKDEPLVISPPPPSKLNATLQWAKEQISKALSGLNIEFDNEFEER